MTKGERRCAVMAAAAVGLAVGGWAGVAVAGEGGACCLPTGLCTDTLDPSGCGAQGGTFFLGRVCAQVDCTIPVCECERDGNEAQVDVFDLLAYLNLWFAREGLAELDGELGITVFDLLAFLDCWFPASAGAPCP